MNEWTRGLNPEQARAVMHTLGPLLILAGAGSGKTTVLVSRTGRLIAEGLAEPKEICVLTFTNKAARELKHRVQAKIGPNAKGLWAGTFHSFGLRFLRENHKLANLPAQFGVIDQSDSQSILRELLKNLTVAGKDKFDLDKILNLVQEFRVKGRFSHPDGDEYHEVATVLAPQYTKKMSNLGVVDFEDLLIKPVELLRKDEDLRLKTQNKFKYMMVDEFQDTNGLQMQLLDLMISSNQNLGVVGDDDQSIYGWRGAQISNILDFPKKFKKCEVIRLERNYRSTSKILELANFIIGQNTKRHGKVLRPEGPRGLGKNPELFVFNNEEEEAEFVVREICEAKNKGQDYSDMAVLYRSNSQAGLLEALLREQQIPFQVSGGTSLFDRKEVKDVLAYLRLTLGLQDLPLRRILNVPARGIGDTSVEKIIEFMQAKHLGFIQAIKHWQEIGINDKAGQAIDHLILFLQGLSQRLFASGQSVGAEFLQVLTEIGYREYVWNSAHDPKVGEKRWMSVEILCRILDRFIEKGNRDKKTLSEFLDAMELRDDPDDDTKKSEVSLMTLHASKGLEFPIVYLIGVEEDLLPHRTLGSDVSEERRLFYVGITRAQERLTLSRCRTRKRYGQPRPVSASRFILGLPAGMLESFDEGARPVSGAARDQMMADFLAKLGSKKNLST